MRVSTHTSSPERSEMDTVLYLMLTRLDEGQAEAGCVRVT